MLRLLWLPPRRESVAVIDLDPNGGMPFWMDYQQILGMIDTEAMEVLTEDPAGATLRADSSLSAAEREVRDNRYRQILPLVEDPDRVILIRDLRGAAVAAHIRAHGGTKKSIYAWLSLWWRRGQLPNALVPEYSASASNRKPPARFDKKRGRPRVGAEVHGNVGVNVTPPIAALLAQGRKYLDKGMSVRNAYEETLRLNFSTAIIKDGQRINLVLPDAEIPSRDQFIYHVVRKAATGDILKAVKGDTSFARKHRARTGTARNDAFGPGSHYQIDATIGNIFLRSHENPARLIGRPVIYIVIDVYSRMIVGFCVALSGPSWETAKLALENAMTDKLAFCLSYGVSITEADWPSLHVCRRLTCDRGKDVTGNNAAAAAAGLGYKLARLPPYRPDWKGLVENRFGLIHDTEIKWAPGSCHGRERGEPKHQLDAVYTLATFTELMLRCILNYNKRFEVNSPPDGYLSPDGRAPVPLDLWEYGVKACGAPQLADRQRVRANLLHAGSARETDKGLYFSGLHYQPADPERHRMFRRVPGRHWKKYEIRFDPRDVSSILVSTDRGAGFEIFYITPADRQFEGWTLDEVEDYRATARIGRRLAADERRGLDSVHEANIADLNRRAMADSKGVKLTPASAGGIRSERADENRRIRADGAWTAMPPTPPTPPTPPEAEQEDRPSPPDPSEAPLADPVVTVTRLDRIRAARDAARHRKDDDE